MEPQAGESGETGHQASLRMATQSGFKLGIYLLGRSLQILAFSRLVPVVDSRRLVMYIDPVRYFGLKNSCPHVFLDKLLLHQRLGDGSCMNTDSTSWDVEGVEP